MKKHAVLDRLITSFMSIFQLRLFRVRGVELIPISSKPCQNTYNIIDGMIYGTEELGSSIVGSAGLAMLKQSVFRSPLLDKLNNFHSEQRRMGYYYTQHIIHIILQQTLQASYQFYFLIFNHTIFFLKILLANFFRFRVKTN